MIITTLFKSTSGCDTDADMAASVQARGFGTLQEYYILLAVLSLSLL